MKYFYFIIFFLSFCEYKSQNTNSTLYLITKEWHLLYHIDRKNIQEKPIEEKIYRFDTDGNFYEKDGKNIGKGFWKLNLDSSKICWTYRTYNQTVYNNNTCNDYRYTIEELNDETLRLSTQSRDGIVYYIFTNSKK
jgi:hypothetical protein